MAKLEVKALTDQQILATRPSKSGTPYPSLVRIIADRATTPIGRLIATPISKKQETTMVEVHLHRDNPQSMAERLQRRTRNSGDVAHADVVSTGDKGIRTNVHKTRNQQYGDGVEGNDIHGRRRGQV